MRTLQNIRSDRVTLEQQSSAFGAAALVVPLLALLTLWAWLFAPLEDGGPLVVSAVLGGLIVWLVKSAWRRKTELDLPRDALLVWEDGLEDQDAYRVLLRTGATEVVLLEHDDPERVLRDVRRLCRETGRGFEGPDWTRSEPLRSDEGRVVLVAGSDDGPHWLAQRDAAWAVVGAGVFVFLIFLGSVRWEAELTWFSAVLPSISVALTFLMAAGLFSLRIRVTTTREAVQVDRLIFGRSRRVLELARSDLVRASAVGHAGYPPRHLLFETLHGPRSIAIAGRAAQLAADRIVVEPIEEKAASERAAFSMEIAPHS